MRKLSLLFVFPLLLAIGCTPHSSTDPLKLSSQYPEAGEKITFSYDPAGTPLAGKTGLESIVYFLDNKDNPAIDVTLQKDGQTFTGSFTIPVTAKFFIVKISKDEEIDNNKGKGFTYFVYKNKKPVQGAYATKANAAYGGLWEYLDKIKTDLPLALNLYQKEFASYPASKKDYQPNYVNALLSAKDPVKRAMAVKQITQMAQSGNEKTMMTAAQMFIEVGKTAQADSVKAVLRSKFPADMAKSDLEEAFYKEKDPIKMEAIYNEYVTTYPEVTAGKSSVQDDFRLEIAGAYLTANKFADYDRMVAKLKNKSDLPFVLNEFAWEKANKGENLDTMAKLSELSLDITKENMKNPKPGSFQSPKTVIKNYQASLDMFGDTYAYILARQGKFKEAYNYEHPIYIHTKGMTVGINENYASILKNMHNDKEAVQVTEDAIKKGKATTPMMAGLKELYIRIKGSDKGYDAYIASLKDVYMKKLKGDLTKQMINKSAPAFALKDFDGKTVSLADLKGKVVVVDFWATWCGPCKASFPGMQIAVNKFKDNPNVRFLFIDTWETGDNYQAGTKKFIADNKYSFKVLEDEKGSDGKQSKIVNAYGVDGIPTKFVLDSNGHIRFMHIGFEGSDEALVDEISAMIDLTANSKSVSPPVGG